MKKFKEVLAGIVALALVMCTFILVARGIVYLTPTAWTNGGIMVTASGLLGVLLILANID